MRAWSSSRYADQRSMVFEVRPFGAHLLRDHLLPLSLMVRGYRGIHINGTVGKGEVRRMEDLHLATAMCIGLRRSSSPHKTSVGTSMFGSRSVVSVSAEDFAIRRKPSGPGQALPGPQEGRLRRVGRSSRWERRKEGRRVGLLHTQVMIGGSRNGLASTQNGGYGLRIGLQVPRFTFFQIGGVGEAEEHMLEGYSALNYLAGITQQVKLDTLVTGVHTTVIWTSC
jgi:hypothetical protein